MRSSVHNPCGLNLYGVHHHCRPAHWHWKKENKQCFRWLPDSSNMKIIFFTPCQPVPQLLRLSKTTERVGRLEQTGEEMSYALLVQTRVLLGSSSPLLRQVHTVVLPSWPWKGYDKVEWKTYLCPSSTGTRAEGKNHHRKFFKDTSLSSVQWASCQTE